jgi:hypothetical protein
LSFNAGYSIKDQVWEVRVVYLAQRHVYVQRELSVLVGELWPALFYGTTQNPNCKLGLDAMLYCDLPEAISGYRLVLAGLPANQCLSSDDCVVVTQIDDRLVPQLKLLCA